MKATLAVMEAEDVCGRGRHAGARLAAGLATLPGVGLGAWRRAAAGRTARGTGGQGGRGVGAPSGACWSTRSVPDAIRVAPPLLVSGDEIDAALRILGDVLADVLADVCTSGDQ